MLSKLKQQHQKQYLRKNSTFSFKLKIQIRITAFFMGQFSKHKPKSIQCFCCVFEIMSTLFFLPTATSKMVPKRKFEIHLETEKSNASNRIYHGPLATAQTKIYVMFLSRLSWKNVFQKLILQRTDLKNFFNCKDLDLLNSHMQQKTGKRIYFFHLR